MDQKQIEELIGQIEQKMQANTPCTAEEKRFLMKHRDGMSDMEIEFAMSGKPEQNGKNGIVY